MENGTYEHAVSHLETNLELNDREAPDELQINTATQQATQQNPENPKQICHHCKKQVHYRNQCRPLKREKDLAQNNTNSGGNKKNGGHINSNSLKKFSNNTNANDQIVKNTENLHLSTHLVRPLVKLTIPQKNVFFWSKRS